MMRLGRLRRLGFRMLGNRRLRGVLFNHFCFLCLLIVSQALLILSITHDVSACEI